MSDDDVRQQLGLRATDAIGDDLRVSFAQDILSAAYDGDLADDREGRCWPVVLNAEPAVADAAIGVVAFMAKAGAEPKADPDLIGIFGDLALAHASLQRAGFPLKRGPRDVDAGEILAKWQH